MSTVNPKYQALLEAYPNMLGGIDVLIEKAKISTRFESIDLTSDENEKLEAAKDLCELRIIELWEQKDSVDFKALCSTYFDLASQIDYTEEKEGLLFEYLKIIAFGYLGEGWHQVRQYISLQITKLNELQLEDTWNRKLLQNSFNALILLIRKKDWRDINNAVDILNQLRNDQNQFESSFLNEVAVENKIQSVTELVSLYHFVKSIDLICQFLIEGRPVEVEVEIKYHLNISKEQAEKSGNINLVLVYKIFTAFAEKIVRNTIWYNTKGINSRVSRFNEFISKKEHHGVFELLYPQKEALGEILNPAHNAVVVNMPTSSGKTMIAEYRLLMALNQFSEDGGWVAYVAPTKALVNQVYTQLNNDLSPIGIKVEKISGALELDGFEESLLERDTDERVFDVLVTTYEKLHLMIRQGYGTKEQRPLVLAIVDEAHNIEESNRGLNLELLLSTIKNDCPRSNFLLLTPDISNSNEIAQWLGGERGKEVHLSLHWWQPNERVIGAITKEGRRRDYEIRLKTLLTNKGTYSTEEDILLLQSKDTDPTFSSLNTKKTFASVVGAYNSDIKEPSIILADNPSSAFDIANYIYGESSEVYESDSEVELLQNFIQDELGENFPLVSYLGKRIGVHSSAIPDEIKFLQEDLMSKGKLKVLVATTTIAQGINFPISSVVMSSKSYPYGEMPIRDFWNLAGRVGRAGQKSLGWVGIVCKDDTDLSNIADYVKRAADTLNSQLVNLINNALSNPEIEFERWLFRDPRWSGVLQYISHLYNQSENLQALISRLEQKLSDTFGYRKLDSIQKQYIRNNLKAYAEKLKPSDAKLSDSTGFSTISIGNLWGGLKEAGLNSSDWNRTQLFSENNSNLQKLVGLMLKTPEIREQIEKLSDNKKSLDRSSISKMMIDWVNGKSISVIANKYFNNEEDPRKRIEKCTKAMYSYMSNAATWGLAAIQKMPNSGADWDKLSDEDKKKMANLPALLHYGVSTDEAVLMRKNNIPRSIALRVGELYSATYQGQIFNKSTSEVMAWINALPNDTWNTLKPRNSKLTGREYKQIWKKLTGLND